MKILLLLFISLNLFAIEPVSTGDIISAEKINTIINKGSSTIINMAGFNWRDSDGFTSSSSGSISKVQSTDSNVQLGILCSDGSLGTATCSTGDEMLGFWYKPEQSGYYKICFSSLKENYGTSSRHHGTNSVDLYDSNNLLNKSGRIVIYGYGSAHTRVCALKQLEEGNTYNFKIYEDFYQKSDSVGSHYNPFFELDLVR